MKRMMGTEHGMDAQIREWIVDVLEQHRSLLAIAVRQSAVPVGVTFRGQALTSEEARKLP